jgi:hypothetical protein
MSNGVGLSLARELIKRKLKGQLEVLEWLKGSASAQIAIKIAWAKVDRAASIEELRFVESEGARAYWDAWETLPLRFTSRDSEKIPEHWKSFGNRSSLISKPSPRRATNPANALLNYVYSILEAEAGIALIRVGLDPAIGIMHFDLRARDSLTCDLMEAIRPQADEFILELIRNREFRKKDFFETSEGICRILPPLTHEISQSAQKWRRLICPITEEIAQRIFQSKSKYRVSNGSDKSASSPQTERIPTPLTGSNRSESRPINFESSQFEQKPTKRRPRKVISWKLDCVRCGKQIDGKHRMYCNGCLF